VLKKSLSTPSFPHSWGNFEAGGHPQLHSRKYHAPFFSNLIYQFLILGISRFFKTYGNKALPVGMVHGSRWGTLDLSTFKRIAEATVIGDHAWRIIMQFFTEAADIYPYVIRIPCVIFTPNFFHNSAIRTISPLVLTNRAKRYIP